MIEEEKSHSGVKSTPEMEETKKLQDEQISSYIKTSIIASAETPTKKISILYANNNLLED